MKIGIVGLPNVGKSTLFQALTKKEVDISNYPFCTIEPNIGIVPVPDERVQKLALFSQSKKIIPAIIEFVDIAGLVRGASMGEGLGNQFLSHIRDVDAIVLVVRLFENPDIIHVEKTLDPVRDMDIIMTELLMKDLETVQKRKEKSAKEARSGNKESVAEVSWLEELEQNIQNQKPASFFLRTSDNEIKKHFFNSLHLLTAKAILFVINGKSEQTLTNILLQKIKECGHGYLIIDIKQELDVRDFSPEEKRGLGIQQSELDTLIQKSYAILNLITFLTTGEDETRAWTIQKGALAPKAAGTIHSDFEKKFIRADVIQWQMLLEAGGWIEARKKGLMRSEGKEYVVQDGDVLEIKHG